MNIKQQPTGETNIALKMPGCYVETQTSAPNSYVDAAKGRFANPEKSIRCREDMFVILAQDDNGQVNEAAYRFLDEQMQSHFYGFCEDHCLVLDSMGVYGEDIIIYWEKICKKDWEIFLGARDYYRLGKLTREDVQLTLQHWHESL